MTLYTTTPLSLDTLVAHVAEALDGMSADATLGDVAEVLDLDGATLVSLLARAVESGRAAVAAELAPGTLATSLGLEAY